MEWIGLVVAIAVLAVLVRAWVKPAEFRYARTVRIAAPAEKIYPLIADLRAFNTWNPFVQGDAGNIGTYSGATEGKGAAYRFEGGRSGSGRFEIMNAQPPGRIEMDLVMLKPFRGDNKVEFTAVANGDATDVTWAMSGRASFVPRLLGLFMNMDTMVGGQFAKGLASLKALAENQR